ncbi:MAG: copper transport protein, partial [Pseudonocardiales bacterium]|nr:copper transport protein [Pseudonocardiales bacterium]
MRRLRVRAVLLLLAGFGLLLLLVAPAASAHAVVVSSDPTDGSRLAKAPATVTVQFDEAVGLDLGYLRAVDSAGRRVDKGSAVHPGGDGSKISVALVAGLGDGSYLASYRVVSADSHPVAGSIRFVVGNGPLGIGGGPSGTTKVDAAVATVLAIVHWLSFAGVGLVGGSWLIFSVWPSGQRRRAIRRAIWTGWGFAAVGAVGEFLIQGPYAAGGGLSTALRGQLLDATLHVNAGQLLSLRLVLLGVLGAVLTALLADQERRRPTWGTEAAAIVGVGIVVTYAATGHSQSANPRWLAVLVDALHLTAMIVWLGGLAILVIAAFARDRTGDSGTVESVGAELVGSEVVGGELVAAFSPGRTGDSGTVEPISAELVGGEPDQDAADATELAAALPIFSRVALAAVATLAVTGTIQAWREVGTVDAITTTWYGRLVVAKVVLLAVLIGLGYLTRRIVQRRDWANRGGPLRRMRRTLLIEALVGAIVLGVTGVLIAQPPGKVALAAVRAKPRFTTVAVTPAAQARVEVTPGTHGTVQIQIAITGNVTPIQVSAQASLPAKQLGPIPVPLQASGPKIYTASGVNLPSA